MGDATASPSSEKWVHLHQQAKIHGQATPSFGFSDATIVATSGASDFTDPTSSITSGTGDQRLKTITRRSRASKKTPATLINASSANFRALVQQFTGCRPNTPISLGSHKGPINLSFGLESARYHSFATAETQPYGNSYYHRPSSQMQQSRQNVQQLHQDQGCNVSLDNLGPRSEMPADCGLFSMDDNIAFQELANESFSDENMNNLDWL
ncbi:VQ MOTIF PROTEIN [Salix purpurea]|uniref:VQ MOTIF PROTEIN n=1 Tax=Salix purpurea TaxID=77065 RepID=A0A9Q0TA10_SALPP|nr:VQ MOTIF PROTEIN [Salix purpurea]